MEQINSHVIGMARIYYNFIYLWKAFDGVCGTQHNIEDGFISMIEALLVGSMSLVKLQYIRLYVQKLLALGLCNSERESERKESLGTC